MRVFLLQLTPFYVSLLPGEFTLRAFLNGRLDLSQAENVEKLISAKSVAAADAALAGIEVFTCIKSLFKYKNC